MRDKKTTQGEARYHINTKDSYYYYQGGDIGIKIRQFTDIRNERISAQVNHRFCGCRLVEVGGFFSVCLAELMDHRCTLKYMQLQTRWRKSNTAERLIDKM